ncbi:YceD family protein [Motiliproteus sp. SC1-56]|uniref:YceD family protein n=1 Tax=Motiliproteus sp. SC1-56 TaxID=2799565 RepID=UPI001A8F43A4|nr:YceD family protein [Motiliproteus sp. SC1-56]
MSKAPLPNKIDPRRSAEQGLSYEGSLALQQMVRLASYLVGDEGAVDVSLSFGKDEEGIRYVKGEAEGTVRMLCQRCLEPVRIELKAQLNLGMVSSEEAASKLPRRYDPLVTQGDPQELYRALEDELILSLPLIAHHDDCEVKTEYRDPDAKPEDDDKVNPFSVLAQLKGDKH